MEKIMSSTSCTIELSEMPTRPCPNGVNATATRPTLTLARPCPHVRARQVYGWLVRTEAKTEKMPLFRGRNFVGSSLQVRLKLADTYVSSQHFVITCGHGAAMIEDLASTNGTWVNGKRIARQLIEHEDAITVGKTRLRYLAVKRPYPFKLPQGKDSGEIIPLPKARA